MKREFEFEGKTYVFRKSTAKDYEGAQKAYNEAFNAALESKAPLRARLTDILREQGVWDDAKQAELETLRKEITKKEKILAKGGISLSAGKKTSLEMRDIRVKSSELLAETSKLDNKTADAQAENAQFNYMVAVLTVYKDTKKPVFGTIIEYLEKAPTELAYTAAINWAKYSNNYDDDAQKKLPENKFLTTFNFADSELRLINSEGKWVDEDGRLLNEEGYYIMEDGSRCDIDGDPVDDDGNYTFDVKPFLDDDGKPVEVPAQEEQEVEAEEAATE
jgi:hypothetical protein